jgi:hypothetical protein
MVGCLERYKPVLNILKFSSQLRGILKLAREKKLSKMAQIQVRKDIRASFCGF